MPIAALNLVDGRTNGRVPFADTMTDQNDAAADAEEYRALNRSIHLLREEVSGLREMLDGAMSALKGAQRAYGAVSQHVDVLSKRVEVAEVQNRRLRSDVERLQAERLKAVVPPGG